jgi:6-phosphogluconolactonase
MSELVVVPDADALASVAAQRFTALASSAIAERGRFIVALSGGSTPRPAYALLAQEPLVSRVDWARVHVFWGDERCVPPEHPDSNYRMASRALLDHVAIPPDSVHRIPGELPPEEAAAVYQAELERVLGAGGRFDLVLLGMGADGHTASLFPGTAAVEERGRAVVAVYVEKLTAWRVTLTLPVIQAARRVVFLVSGAGKAPVLARVHAGEALPAGLVRPKDGQLIWLADRDAAADLSESRHAPVRGGSVLHTR